MKYKNKTKKCQVTYISTQFNTVSKNASAFKTLLYNPLSLNITVSRGQFWICDLWMYHSYDEESKKVKKQIDVSVQKVILIGGAVLTIYAL